jgi:hypothetical protein
VPRLPRCPECVGRGMQQRRALVCGLHAEAARLRKVVVCDPEEGCKRHIGSPMCRLWILGERRPSCRYVCTKPAALAGLHGRPNAPSLIAAMEVGYDHRRK